MKPVCPPFAAETSGTVPSAAYSASAFPPGTKGRIANHRQFLYIGRLAHNRQIAATAYSKNSRKNQQDWGDWEIQGLYLQSATRINRDRAKTPPNPHREYGRNKRERKNDPTADRGGSPARTIACAARRPGGGKSAMKSQRSRAIRERGAAEVSEKAAADPTTCDQRRLSSKRRNFRNSAA